MDCLPSPTEPKRIWRTSWGHEWTIAGGWKREAEKPDQLFTAEQQSEELYGSLVQEEVKEEVKEELKEEVKEEVKGDVKEEEVKREEEEVAQPVAGPCPRTPPRPPFDPFQQLLTPPPSAPRLLSAPLIAPSPSSPSPVERHATKRPSPAEEAKLSEDTNQEKEDEEDAQRAVKRVKQKEAAEQ